MSGSGISLSRRRRQNPLINSAAFSFRFGWLVLVVWNEVGQFYWSVSSCRWSKLERKLPKIAPTPSNRRPRATRILLISDAQLIDFHSPSFKRKPWKTAITEFVVDTYLKKAWSVAKQFKPDAVFFLGDQLDSGRATLSDAEFQAYVARFKHIFCTPHDLRTFYIPGNRDVGLGTSRSFSPHARDRYQQYFGAVNQEVTLGNHTFVMLDAPGLIEEDYRRYASEVRFGEWDGQDGGSIEFLHRLGNTVPKFPRILLSHVPLTRRERVECGPNREGGGFISNGAGLGYQKLLGAETSTFLMEKVKPTLIFSGDDHDYCDYTHPNSVREVTVKTFSMAMGISTPGFQILSLVPPNPSNPTAPTHADMACNLPNQLGIYFNIYVPFTVITLLVLLFLNAKKSYRRRRPTPLNILTAPSSGSNSPMRHSSNPLIGTNPLKSPRLGSNTNLGMTPFASPNPTRRSSRSMPPSPTASPRLGYHPSSTEAHLAEEPSFSSFAIDAGPSTLAGNGPTRPSSFYLAGFHAAASQLDIEYNDSTTNLQSPSALEEGNNNNASSSSYFLPLPRSSSGIGLGLSSPATPSGSNNSNNNNNNNSASTSSRPGQVRKVSRILEKENTLLPSTTRASRGESIGIQEVLVDLRRAIGVPRKVWGLLGGEESLGARWLKDVFSVFWPAWVAFVVLNACYR